METQCRQFADTPAVPLFVLLEKLGEGGMGEVYLAHREGSEERVAVKLLSPTEKGDQQARRQRFERETRFMAKLSHPNIVRVLEHGHVNGRPYLVMEFVDGRDLRGWMKPGCPVPVAQTRRVIAETASALAYLGDAGIVHRDLKPENVLLDEHEKVKITDFGISVAVTEVGQLTQTAEVLGTVDYMAPEQRARLPVDQRADQFSLAVIAYELLTGKRPLGNFKPPSQLNPQLHPAVDAVLARALEEDPDDRYPDVREFAAALEKSLQRKVRRWLRPVIAASVVGVAVAAIGSATIAWRGGRGADGFPPQLLRTLGQSAQVDYFIERGDRHLDAGHAIDAKSCYAEAIRLSPDDPVPYLKRAFAYKMGKAYQAALDDLQMALELDPQLVDAWIGRGSIYVTMKDYTRAIPELDQAIRLDENAAEAWAYRGWARYGLGDVEQARRDLDTAVAADPSLGVAYQFRGLFHKKLGELQRARDDFAAAVRHMPGAAYMHAALAQLLVSFEEEATDEDRRLAVEHARKACELTRWDDHKRLRDLAAASDFAGDIAGAIDFCLKAIEAAPPIERKVYEDDLATYKAKSERMVATAP
jgi:tetratricopeptide (TPR) repeat protein